MMDREAFELVFEPLEKNLDALRRKWKRESGIIPWGMRCAIARLLGRREPSDEVEGPVQFDLFILNGRCGPLEGLVSLNLWADIGIPGKLAIFECSPTTKTVAEGFREVWAQLRVELDQETDDLADFPVEATFGELMRELAKIAVAMSPPGVEFEIGRDHGPEFIVQFGRDCLLLLDGSTGATITFKGVKKEFADRSCRDWDTRNIHIECLGENPLDALEEAVALAHKRSRMNHPDYLSWPI